MHKTLLRVGLIFVFITLMVIGALWLFTPWQADLQQQQAEKGVEVRLKAYLQAIMRQDQQAALKLWDLSAPLPAGSEPLLQQRR
jgi:sensor domain CHASE-containing protein